MSNDISTAIKTSEDRKARLTKALSAPVNRVNVHARNGKLGAELSHLEGELAPHGLSVADLLRTVAKHFHGVTVSTMTVDDYVE